MFVGDRRIECEGDLVRVIRHGKLVASGRLRAGSIVERAGSLDGMDETSAWQAIEEALRAAADAFVAASVSAAYDARGVDVTQIDRMLALTPAERLAVLDGERHSMLQLLGDAPRD